MQSLPFSYIFLFDNLYNYREVCLMVQLPSSKIYVVGIYLLQTNAPMVLFAVTVLTVALVFMTNEGCISVEHK